MPSIAQAPSSTPDQCPSSMKKRKREQQVVVESDGSMKLCTAQTLNHTHTSPLQSSHSLFDIDVSNFGPAECFALKPRLLKSMRNHDAKRQRIQGLLEASSPYSNEYSKSNFSPQDTKVIQRQSTEANLSRSGYSKTDISSCHICHQKPKVKSDLDSYANCELCCQRTCFICMRQCLGPPQLTDLVNEDEDTRMALSLQMLMDDDLSERGGIDGAVLRPGTGPVGPSSESHKDMVCSRCCVERGADGEVRCLGCLKAEELE